MNHCTVALSLILSVCSASAYELWYDRPAAGGMNEALPIGNGKVGALIYGDPARERVVLNEDSFWTGTEISSDDYSKMGSYQMFGEVLVELSIGSPTASVYRRSLDISRAIHRIEYRVGDVNYTREAFASHPAGVIAFRFRADQKAAYSGRIRLKGTHGESTQAQDASLVFTGRLDNALRYRADLRVSADGGSVKPDGDSLVLAGVDQFDVFIAMGTDYVMDHGRGYRGEHPEAAMTRRLETAVKQGYDRLLKAHVADYRSYYERVELDVGTSAADRVSKPISERKVLAEQGGDPDLEELLFQYGRYLMISSSRPGTLPANLQGIWCDSNNPPWHSDYHANINIQMNYWPAEPAHLPECHTALFDLIQSQIPAWRKATAAEKRFQLSGSNTTTGWAVRTSHGINGDLGWQWDITANAWYAQHFWMHFSFIRDREWLRTVAYPLLKEVAGFWDARLKALPDGRLVVPNGWSPEHGPHEDGVSYCQQIVWDLFNNYAAAARELDVDRDYRTHIEKRRDQLLGPQIGRWGQLQEWMTDRDDPNNHHRHTSHLFGVFPGQQISHAIDPKFADAARVSLVARTEGPGTDVREWSFAWRCGLYARLRDGDNAYRMVRNLFSKRNTCPNLFGLHPPMQIDGNFGITAGICEMLLQSHAGAIELLPALPQAWNKGSFKGLRARGGYVVDVSWSDGKVTDYRLVSAEGGKATVRVNGEQKTVRVRKP